MIIEEAIIFLQENMQQHQTSATVKPTSQDLTQQISFSPEEYQVSFVIVTTPARIPHGVAPLPVNVAKF